MVPRVRRRLTLSRPGLAGSRRPDPVDLLYIDSAHGYADTVAELRAWSAVLHRGADVFDDYANPNYPEVKQAIADSGWKERPAGRYRPPGAAA